LILHLFGDYILQNDKMAFEKKKKTTKGFWYCIWHCLLYTIPFLLITNYIGAFLIFLSHFLIDRYNIIQYFIKIKNGTKNTNNFGYSESVNKRLACVLFTLHDNIIHLIINYLIILHL
jgi:hypothetical protein